MISLVVNRKRWFKIGCQRFCKRPNVGKVLFGRQGVVVFFTSAKEHTFSLVCLSVCLSVCLFSMFMQKNWTDRERHGPGKNTVHFVAHANEGLDRVNIFKLHLNILWLSDHWAFTFMFLLWKLDDNDCSALVEVYALLLSAIWLCCCSIAVGHWGQFGNKGERLCRTQLIRCIHNKIWCLTAATTHVYKPTYQNMRLNDNRTHKYERV